MLAESRKLEGNKLLDHIEIMVSDVARRRRFYEAALAPLGFHILKDFGQAVGFGKPAARPQFFIAIGHSRGAPHVAFAAANRAAVKAFYDAAIAAGGRDNGPPGLRPQYHPNYYGAFVFDPDGNNVEAVCHDSD